MANSFNDKYPKSKGSIDRMGKAIKAGDAYDVNEYEEWFLWNSALSDLASQYVLDILADFVQSLHDSPDKFRYFPADCDMSVSSRAKTIDTTKQKLIKMDKTSLARIQDISGVRVDGPFTLAGQMRVAEILREELLEMGATRVDIKDFRDLHHSGYRAVHLHVNAEAGRLEVQVRTNLQSKWSNLSEVVADRLGRQLRYLSDPKDSDKAEIVQALWDLSHQGYAYEKNFSRVADACAAGWSLLNRANISDGERQIAEESLQGLEEVQGELRREILGIEAQFERSRASIESNAPKSTTQGED